MKLKVGREKLMNLKYGIWALVSASPGLVHTWNSANPVPITISFQRFQRYRDKKMFLQITQMITANNIFK